MGRTLELTCHHCEYCSPESRRMHSLLVGMRSGVYGSEYRELGRLLKDVRLCTYYPYGAGHDLTTTWIVTEPKAVKLVEIAASDVGSIKSSGALTVINSLAGCRLPVPCENFKPDLNLINDTPPAPKDLW